ncbi:hypothetical protein EVAR_91293_1 [Eumeta japonica]|uniref:Uncharacterized protein n=1 Tax=Eumeta variegata TaxID=151549 RepID=A0A4C2A166_EUMVA|nr:hypothetical protein EVAR_91293_1 [Eumeta japonica]
MAFIRINSQMPRKATLAYPMGLSPYIRAENEFSTMVEMSSSVDAHRRVSTRSKLWPEASIDIDVYNQCAKVGHISTGTTETNFESIGECESITIPQEKY